MGPRCGCIMVTSMKKLLLSLLLLPGVAFAGAYDLLITQRNSTDSGNFIRTVAVPSPGPNTSGVMMFDGNTTLPKHALLGTGLSWDGSTLSVTGGFSGAYGDLTGIPSTFAPSAHTHAASDINSGTLADARIPSLAISKTTGLQAALDGKLTIPTGSVAQYVAGDGSVASRSFSYSTRSLNTCFQVSATRDAMVSYAVDIAATLSLSGGQQGTVFLELFTDSGCTTGTQEVTRATNGNTGTLTIGLNTVQTSTARLSGVIPAGLYLRLRTANDTGTPTFTARPGQETLL